MPLDERNPTRRVLILDGDEEWTARLTASPHARRLRHTRRCNTSRSIENPAGASSSRTLWSTSAPATGATRLRNFCRFGRICLASAWHAPRTGQASPKRSVRVHSISLPKSDNPIELRDILERCFNKHVNHQKGKAQLEILWRAKEAAEAASRAKSEFLATVSHELRDTAQRHHRLFRAHDPRNAGPDREQELSRLHPRHPLQRPASSRNHQPTFSTCRRPRPANWSSTRARSTSSELAGIVLRLVGPRARESGIEASRSHPAETSAALVRREKTEANVASTS